MKWVTRIMVVLMLGAAACGGPGVVDDAGSSQDGGPLAQDSGAFAVDAGGTTDGGSSAFDAGTADAGTADAGTADAGTADAGTADAGTADAGTADAGTADAGTADAGTADAGVLRAWRVFSTRATYDGDLRHGAGVESGLHGADVLCAAAAASARLPGTFQAWLSVPGVDAKTRLPANGGPWYLVQPDGGTASSFFETSNWATTPGVPLSVNEFGEFAVAPYPWTGTLDAGTASANTCAGFETNSGGTGATVGSNSSTQHWASWTVMTCDHLLGLACYQVSDEPPAPAPPSLVKRVFVTSTTYPGDLATAAGLSDGLAAGDALCAARAGEPGTQWVAWLSSPTVNAFDRITTEAAWYQYPDGGEPVLTFANRAMLRTRPLAALQITESGDALGTNNSAWTGTASGGGASGRGTCNGFTTSVTGLGQYGSSALNPTQEWSNYGSTSCSALLRLMCFEQ